MGREGDSCTLTLHPYSVLPQQPRWEDCDAASGGSPLEPGKEGDLGYIRQEFRPSAGFRNSAVEGISQLISTSCFLKAEYAGLGHYSMCSV